MPVTVTETFFQPDEIGRETSAIPADIYNLLHTILARSDHDCVFVPVRRLQYLAVVTAHEVVFVDSMAYHSEGEQGGRLIMLAWDISDRNSRSSLEAPVACDVIYYHDSSRDIQSRLIGDLRHALQEFDRYYRDEAIPAAGAKILPMA